MRQKLFRIRNGNKTYNILERPAFIIDRHHKTIIAISEIEEIEEMFVGVKKMYTTINRPNDIIKLELPLDQNTIDKAYNDINFAIQLHDNSNRELVMENKCYSML